MRLTLNHLPRSKLEHISPRQEDQSSPQIIGIIYCTFSLPSTPPTLAPIRADAPHSSKDSGSAKRICMRRDARLSRKMRASYVTGLILEPQDRISECLGRF